ncbi:Helix-turn-helix [Catalinimonas alkaloidigena]|uniref:Helix-turn-helix n=1 Tax=Catalinimonas alkaloidigena TaxID=1075417 RepID=A0A1G9VIC6_9BACT|nr:helicase-related protein [Catalinimonas alkaloidigena]SDM71833.1 Helix-turn-helix [Catalinimonas alkaloidigena]
MSQVLPEDYPLQLQGIRTRHNLTQTQLAELLGVSFATVNRWERKHTKPSLETWQKIQEIEVGAIVAEQLVSAKLENIPDTFILDFLGNAKAARSVVEGERLSQGHQYNPAYAVETARIDPLPHQRVAVYERMLLQPRLRFLLADDAGAGKTIMTGLYIREMLNRKLLHRILIVAPAGIVSNWQREMQELFGLSFKIMEGGHARSEQNPFLGNESDFLVISVDTLRQDRMFRRLQEPEVQPYDLVVFDEAHKLAVRQSPDGREEKTQRYRLAEALAGVFSDDERWALSWSTQHLLLLTATPHMGDDYPYFGLWRLLDPEVFQTPKALNLITPDARRRYFIRRIKEEMIDFDENRIYPPRETNTLSFSYSAEERCLYQDLTNYMKHQYNQARFLNRKAAIMAINIFQRRLASSTEALRISLARRLEKLEYLVNEVKDGGLTEVELERRQLALDKKILADPFLDMTGDEEESKRNQEQNERIEDDILGVVVTTIAELEEEQNAVKHLLDQAEKILADGYDAKFRQLKDYIDNDKHGREKLLIFTEYKDTLNFLVRRLEGIGYAAQVAYIHGGLKRRERDEQADFFRRPTERGGAQFLVATDAAGEGINLQFCWQMVNYDLPWNPARLEQRMGRIHRYGQKHRVVSITNFLAQDTREGQVLQALSRKLEAIRVELTTDKVFDVIGKILPDQTLRQYMKELIDRPESVHETVEQIEAISAKKVSDTISEERERYGTEDDLLIRVKPLKAAYERERLRQLLPGYLLRYVREAAPLLGLSLIAQDDAGTLAGSDPEKQFHFQARESGAFDGLLPVLEGYGVDVRHPIRFTRPDKNDKAIWFRPGEPLFERFRALLAARYDEDAHRGAVLIDPTAAKPYFMHVGYTTVLDGKEGGASQRTLEQTLTALLHEPGQEPIEIPLEKLLLMQPGEELPMAFRHLLRESKQSLGLSEHKLNALTEQRVAFYRQERLDTATERANYLRRGFDLHLAEVAQERSKARRDTKGSKKLELIKERQARVRQQRDVALMRLDQEGTHIHAVPAEWIAHFIIIPSSSHEVRARFDQNIELRAMTEAVAYERQRNAKVWDVSTPARAQAMNLTDWPGFDLLSKHETGERAIEVKGRADVGMIEMTENEWAKACNLRGRYWLYVVFNCATTRPTLYRIQDPFGKLMHTVKRGYCIDVTEIHQLADI